MANTPAGTVWNLPNYLGEIFTASHTETPILAMLGGMGAGMQTDNFEFPVAQTYDQEAAGQPAITETASLTAPTVISYVRAQAKNVCQIFQEQVSVSYERLANQGRLSGIATAGQNNPVTDELDFQIAKALEKIRRDIEYTILNGAYQIATNAGVANKTRGLIACATSNTTNASSATLSKSLMDTALMEAYTNGARWRNGVIICGAFQKVKLSDIYGYAPTDRNIGGVSVNQIETDFGNFGVMLHPHIPAGTLLIADMGVVRPVVQPVPGKGNFFYEELSKTGAGESGQIFGKFGLDHGPEFAHATITSLATS